MYKIALPSAHTSRTDELAQLFCGGIWCRVLRDEKSSKCGGEMMQETTRQELRTLLTSAQIELRNEATRYAALLKHLELLEQSIAVSELSDELLASTMAAFPPNVKPMRAGTPTGEGLKETRKLWDELNHIVKSRQKKAV